MTRIAVLVGILLVAVAPLLVGGYGLTLLNYIGIASLVALGLVLLTGVGGLTSFGQAAFMGIGAYATAWLTTTYGVSAWFGLLLALAMTGLVAAILGAATLRLGGHLLPLSTIAWGLALDHLFGNLDVVGRHNGMSGLPAVAIGEFRLTSDTAGFYLIWAILAVTLLLCANLLDSRPGRALRSLRGGTGLAESLGVNSFRMKLAVFVLAAMLAGVAGWLLAHVQRAISPTAFDVGPGIEYLFMAMLGGAGQVAGAVLGAAMVTLGRDALQDGLAHIMTNSGQAEAIVFGVLFIVLLQRFRGGVIPSLQRFFPPRTPPLPAPAAPLPRRAVPQAGTALLQIEAAEKRFGGLVAVAGVGFSVAAGEIVGLIGPNGAGKSTLFNLITGAMPPGGGRFTFDGHDVTRMRARRIALLGMARTFQHVKLRPRMSLLENTMLGTHPRTRAGVLAAALRLDRAEERQAAAEAMRQLERVGLDANPHDLAGSLPLGSQRLLEVARALAADPLLLVLDEPAAGLRRPEKLALADLLRRLRGEGLTILLVEHDMDFVMGLVDRIVVMDFGVKLAEGLPGDIRANPAVQAAYLGAPA